MESTII